MRMTFVALFSISLDAAATVAVLPAVVAAAVAVVAAAADLVAVVVMHSNAMAMAMAKTDFLQILWPRQKAQAGGRRWPQREERKA